MAVVYWRVFHTALPRCQLLLAVRVSGELYLARRSERKRTMDAERHRYHGGRCIPLAHLLACSTPRFRLGFPYGAPPLLDPAPAPVVIARPMRRLRVRFIAKPERHMPGVRAKIWTLKMADREIGSEAGRKVGSHCFPRCDRRRGRPPRNRVDPEIGSEVVVFDVSIAGKFSCKR